jgi:hypothetical protein
MGVGTELGVAVHSFNPGTGKASEIHGAEASTYVASTKSWAKIPKLGSEKDGEILRLTK